MGEIAGVHAVSMNTDRLYTGQRNLASLGLMDYHARFYEPTLGVFIQPDTMMPSAANPQSLNRYSYVLNDPINLNDPSGYKPCWATKRYSCDLSKWGRAQADAAVASYSPAKQASVVAFFKSQNVPVSPISTGGNGGGSGNAATTGTGSGSSISGTGNTDLISFNTTINARYATLALQTPPPPCPRCAIDTLWGIIHIGEGLTVTALSIVVLVAVLSVGPEGLIAAPFFLAGAAIGVNSVMAGVQDIQYAGTDTKPDPLPLVHLFFPDFIKNK
jgi:RHS repeat-associated protein